MAAWHPLQMTSLPLFNSWAVRRMPDSTWLFARLTRHPLRRRAAQKLAAQPDTVGFLLPVMGKEELFPTVIRDGALPRKTFSMGEAHDKRFYLEARKIRD